MPRQTDLLPARRRPSTWGWLVTGSAVVVAACAIALFTGWLASSRTTVGTYSVRGSVSGITLDLGNADAEIVGGGDRPALEVRRTDRYAFGRRAEGTRAAAGGVLMIRSRCPKTFFGVCSAAYRLTVPDNVRVTVRTTSGNVRFTGYRGSAEVDTGTGDITVGGFCGFALRARAQAGDVTATASCALERLELRSRTGDVRAVVPPGPLPARRGLRRRPQHRARRVPPPTTRRSRSRPSPARAT